MFTVNVCFRPVQGLVDRDPVDDMLVTIYASSPLFRDTWYSSGPCQGQLSCVPCEVRFDLI